MKPIVFLSGWGYEPTLWHALSAELDGQPCHALDLRLESRDVEACVERIAPSLPTGCLVVAWSLGALIALSLAARHPERVAGMLLIGATPCFARRENWAHGMAGDTMAAFTQNFDERPLQTLKRFLALQLLGDSARSILQSTLAPHLCQTPAAWPGLANGLKILASTDLRDRLPSAPIPCTLLHGKHDALIPLEAAQHLHQGLPRSRLIVDDEAGHAPWFTSPGRLAGLIRTCQP
jgi:pimeloyl-[acyl-carrier protein] methyl ester esterase